MRATARLASVAVGGSTEKSLSALRQAIRATCDRKSSLLECLDPFFPVIPHAEEVNYSLHIDRDRQRRVTVRRNLMFHACRLVDFNVPLASSFGACSPSAISLMRMS